MIAHSLSVNGPGLLRIDSGTRTFADVVEDGAELHVANRVEVELELGRNGDREPDDLFGVAAGARILGFERIGERRQSLAVEALSALLVLEAGDEGAHLCGRDLGQVPLQTGKDAGSGVVELD